MNRKAIFVFYDKDGVADGNVVCLLKGLRQYCSEILCVVNGALSADSREVIGQYCSGILMRENKGFDSEAYVEGYHRIKPQLQETDELVFCNDTCFGPVFDFGEMFSAMETRSELDFWGVTRLRQTVLPQHAPLADGSFFIPEHIQSYFWVLRRSIFAGQELEKWFAGLPAIRSYLDAITYFETRFTKYFEALGFRWDTYIRPAEDDVHHANASMAQALSLLRDQRCPLVKRKAFLIESWGRHVGTPAEHVKQLYEYLRDHTQYDTALIAQYLTRTQQPAVYIPLLALTAQRETPQRGQSFAAGVLLREPQAAGYLAQLHLDAAVSCTVLCADDACREAAKQYLPFAAVAQTNSGDMQQLIQALAKQGAAYTLVVDAAAQMRQTANGKWQDAGADWPALLTAVSAFSEPAQLLAACHADAAVGAVVPYPMTHMQHYCAASHETDAFLTALQREQASLETACMLLSREVLQQLQQLLCQHPHAAAHHLGYMVSLACQKAGKLVSFAAQRDFAWAQGIWSSRQLHKLAAASGAGFIGSEDQAIVYQNAVSGFYEAFFSPKSLKQRVYFALMSLLGYKRFRRLLLRLGKDPGFDYSTLCGLDRNG